MHFDEPTGDRTRLALELLSEGKFVNFRGLGLQVNARGVFECRVFSQFVPENVDRTVALQQFTAGQNIFVDLIAASSQFAALLERPCLWELLYDYGKGAIRLCHLQGSSLVWERGFSK